MKDNSSSPANDSHQVSTNLESYSLVAPLLFLIDSLALDWPVVDVEVL